MKISWKESAVCYQVYPRSFKDSNHDGIGDIPGIIEKLDYLKDLGIDVIWVSPFYKSPNADNGYDISDYQDIMDEFGTIEDCKQLIKEVHKRGMKIIIDLVINHTSDEHAWFIESISSKDSPKRDWYIWKKGDNGKAPNNWESIFEGSAWQYDEASDEYYLHIFDKKQPDLNWENQEVRNALYDMVNWWLDQDIDGFRVDAISHIKKDITFEDMKNPDNLEYVPCFDKMMNYPGIDEMLQDLKKNTFSKHNIMTVGEANGVEPMDAHLWSSKENGHFDMIFQFQHLKLWNEETSELDLVAMKKTLDAWQQALDGIGWNALYIENHDLPRVISTWGNDKEYWKESAKTLALMYFMQKGTPFIYQGQEIGMTNIHVNEIEEYREQPTAIRYYKNIENGMDKKDAMAIAYATTRANSRTPMQWDDEPYGGFSTVSPWMNTNENYKEINVATQIRDKDSIYHFYKELISIRKTYTSLIHAKCNLIHPEDKNIYAYTRTTDKDTYLVVCNMSSMEQSFDYGKKLTGKFLITTHSDIIVNDNIVTLRPYESFMLKQER